MGLLGDADPDAFADHAWVDWGGLLVVGSEPERAFPAKVEAIQRAVDPQGGGEPPGSARQIAEALDAAPLPHDRNAVQRLQRPDQDTGADARRLARHVQHEGGAVGQVDIGVAALEKQRAVARGHPAIGVPGGVAHDIGLGLDDAPAGDAFRQRPHHQPADEKAGERGGIDRQLRTGERAVEGHDDFRLK